MGDSKAVNSPITWGYVKAFFRDIEDATIENLKLKKDECFRYISRHKIDNIEYNKELFEFILENNMLDFDEDYIYENND